VGEKQAFSSALSPAAAGDTDAAAIPKPKRQAEEDKLLRIFICL
jgi:hypothetical protein